MKPRQITEPARPVGDANSKSAQVAECVWSVFPQRSCCSSPALQRGSRLRTAQRSAGGAARELSPVLGARWLTSSSRPGGVGREF